MLTKWLRKQTQVSGRKREQAVSDSPDSARLYAKPALAREPLDHLVPSAAMDPRHWRETHRAMMYSPGLHPRGATQREEQWTMDHMKSQQDIARDRRAPLEKEALEKGVPLAAVNMAVTITELQNLVEKREALQNAFTISGDRLIHAVIQTDHRYHERMARNKAEKMLFPSVYVTSSALVASSASSRRASDATVTADHPGTDQAQDAHMAVEASTGDVSPLSRQQQLRTLFEAMDLDNSGCIDADELSELAQMRRDLYHESSGNTWTTDMNNRLLKIIDTDGDGQIDKDEFCAHYIRIFKAKDDSQFSTWLNQFKEVSQQLQTRKERGALRRTRTFP